MKRILIALAVSTALTGGVYAGDLNHRGGLKDPVERQGRLPEPEVQQERGVNWSGFYLGGRAGYGNANHETTLDLYEAEDGGATPEPNGRTSVDLLGLDGINSRGFVGGGQVGYDQQLGRFVVGVFGSYDFSSMESTLRVVDDPNIGETEGPTYDSFSLEKGDEWSIGARAGLLVNPKTMVYLLAAYTQTEYEISGPGVDDSSPQLSKEETFDGVTVGGGVEFAIANNIFAGLEYTHLFGGEATWFDSCRGEGDCDVGSRVTDDLSEDKVMGTLKIKLNNDIGKVFD